MASAPTGDPDGGWGPHVFVADVTAPALAEADRHHLTRSLRLRPGDPLTVADGAGRWRACRLGAEPEPVGEVVVVPPPEPRIAVAFAPVKGDRHEWVVKELTELGVDEIVVLEADRSVVRWGADRARRQQARLLRIAREAAMQCRRSRLPVLAGPEAVAQAATRPGAALAQRGGGPPSPATTCVLVGPEGGWSPAERSLGLPEVGLGEPVLRAETAAVAAATLLTALRAGLVTPCASGGGPPSPRATLGG